MTKYNDSWKTNVIINYTTILLQISKLITSKDEFKISAEDCIEKIRDILIDNNITWRYLR